MNSLITIEEMCSVLKNIDNVCFIAHKSPDGDTLGSSFAMKYAFCKFSKKAYVICSDDVPKKLSFLGTLDSLNDVSSNTTFIGIDLADVTLLGNKLSHLKNRIKLCIDHHMSNTMYAEKSLVKKESAATAEIVYEVISRLNIPIDTKIASCIYTAVSTDTGCFKYANTTAQSHTIAAKMIELGCDIEKINKQVFNTKSKAQLKLETKVLNTLNFYFDGICALIEITNEIKTSCGATDDDLSQMSSIPCQVEGVLVGITLKETDSQDIKISVRTDGKINASKICSHFGGGGHKAAAGCVINSSLSCAKNKILKVVGQTLKEELQNGRNFINQ